MKAAVAAFTALERYQMPIILTPNVRTVPFTIIPSVFNLMVMNGNEYRLNSNEHRIMLVPHLPQPFLGNLKTGRFFA